MSLRHQANSYSTRKDELVPGRMDLLASSAEMGNNTGQIDASVEGDETQIAFNIRYLRDALTALCGGEVALEVTGPTSPGLLKPISGTGHLHVIVPSGASQKTPLTANSTVKRRPRRSGVPQSGRVPFFLTELPARATGIALGPREHAAGRTCVPGKA